MKMISVWDVIKSIFKEVKGKEKAIRGKIEYMEIKMKYIRKRSMEIVKAYERRYPIGGKRMALEIANLILGLIEDIEYVKTKLDELNEELRKEYRILRRTRIMEELKQIEI